MLFLPCLELVVCATIIFDGVADDNSTETALANTKLLNSTLASLPAGDTFLIPNKTFTYVGGVYADGLTDVTIQLDGTLLLSADTKNYPTDEKGMPIDAIHLVNSQNVTLTSSGTGTLNGQGTEWWGIMKYLVDTNHRPIMMHVNGATDLLIENWLFTASPRFNFYGEGLNRVRRLYTKIFVTSFSPNSIHAGRDQKL
jgi:hypothetical protein